MKIKRVGEVGTFWHTGLKICLHDRADTQWFNFFGLNKGDAVWRLYEGSKLIGDRDES